jgi:hypothetical protein
MARLRRRWRVVKWVGCIACILIAGAWACSLLFNMHYTSRAFGASLWRGTLILSHWPWHGDGLLIRVAPIKPTWTVDILDFAKNDPNGGGLPEWSPVRFSYIRSGRFAWFFYLPLWVPFLLAAFPTAVLLWLDRRRIPPHCCQSCGYDLTGNVSGVCPECGRTRGP